MPTRTLTRAPAHAPLYLKAALPAVPLLGRLARRGHDAAAAVPDLRLVRTGVRTDAARLNAYNAICGFGRGDTLPVTYPHLAAFGLQLMLMTDPAFPFAPMGLVHVRNAITQHRPLGTHEVFDLSVHAAGLRTHPSGRLVDLVSSATVDGATVWSETTTLLSRQPGGAPEPAAAPLAGVEPPAGVVHWPLAGNLGRRYAAVSGDRNPIHLYPLTARAFGFPRTIAHGMWTKARCLAALGNRLPDRFTVQVEFRKPILLPATVVFGFARTADGHRFGVTGARQPAATHLVGRVTG